MLTVAHTVPLFVGVQVNTALYNRKDIEAIAERRRKVR